ncbi:unnamed protein product [Rhodiola kirilowii]
MKRAEHHAVYKFTRVEIWNEDGGVERRFFIHHTLVTNYPKRLRFDAKIDYLVAKDYI